MTIIAITSGKLQKGDVILSTTDEFVSKTVRLATNSKYSHARIYIGTNSIIEAIDPEIRKRNLSLAIKGDSYASVYRHPGLTTHQQTKIINYANKQLGKEYDLSGALGSTTAGIAVAGILPTLENIINSESDFYCSELVAFAYKSAGINLERFSSLTTPEDLARNNKLQYIGHLKI